MENGKRELPPWKIFAKSCSVIWEKKLFALYISIPFAILTFLQFTAHDLMGIKLPSSLSTQSNPIIAIISSPSSWAIIIWNILYFLLGVLLAVFWHRSILLGENSITGLPVRFDRPVGHYLLSAIIIGIIGLGVNLLSLLLFYLFSSVVGGSGGAIIFIFLFIPIVAIMAVVMFRVSLALPAAAIGWRDFGIREAWKVSKGYGWDLFGVLLVPVAIMLGVVFVGAIGIFLVLPFVYGSLLLPSVPYLVLQGLKLLYVIVVTLISIGMLSITFAYLTYEPSNKEAEGG